MYSMPAGPHENPSRVMWEGNRVRSYWILIMCDAASERRGRFILPHSFDDLPWLGVMLMLENCGKQRTRQPVNQRVCATYIRCEHSIIAKNTCYHSVPSRWIGRKRGCRTCRSAWHYTCTECYKKSSQMLHCLLLVVAKFGNNSSTATLLTMCQTR